MNTIFVIIKITSRLTIENIYNVSGEHLTLDIFLIKYLKFPKYIDDHLQFCTFLNSPLELVNYASHSFF